MRLSALDWEWPWDWDWSPSDWADDIVTWLSEQALKGLTNMWGLLADKALLNPDVTQLSQVRELNTTSMVIVNSCYVLAIIVAGVLVMTKDTMQIRYGIGDLAPRLVVGLIAANMASFITSTLIGLSNGFTRALTGEGIASAGAFGHLRDTVNTAVTGNGVDLLLLLILTVVIAGLTAALLVMWLVRIGVLVVLAGVAPIALACHGLPFTESAAKLWWRTMFGTLGTVVVQALLLHAALSMFLDPNTDREQLGLNTTDTGTLNLFIVVCLMMATVKVPGLMRRYVMRGGGGNAVTAFARVMLIQQLTRGLKFKAPARLSGGRVGAGRGRTAARNLSGPRGDGDGAHWRPRGRAEIAAGRNAGTAAGSRNAAGTRAAAANAATSAGQRAAATPPAGPRMATPPPADPPTADGARSRSRRSTAPSQPPAPSPAAPTAGSRPRLAVPTATPAAAVPRSRPRMAAPPWPTRGRRRS